MAYQGCLSPPCRYPAHAVVAGTECVSRRCSTVGSGETRTIAKVALEAS